MKNLRKNYYVHNTMKIEDTEALG